MGLATETSCKLEELAASSGGGKLPTVRSLAATWGVSVSTVQATSASPLPPLDGVVSERKLKDLPPGATVRLTRIRRPCSSRARSG